MIYSHFLFTNLKVRLVFLIGLLLISTLSCTEEDLLFSEELVEPEPTAPVGYLNVDERLWSFFEKFEEEGKKQGIDIDLRSEEITGEIIEIHEDRVAGQCNFNRIDPNHVTIDLEFWNEASDLAKEFVVYHELGHCFLFRDHREDTNPNGTCKSLMRSGIGDCRDNYNNFTKGSYLNELFDKRFAGDIFEDPDI